MSVEKQILEIIDEKVRPALQSHGGDIEFVEFDEGNGVLKVRLQGACGSCPFAQETLRAQVEAVLKRDIPEIKSVVRER